MTEKRFTYDNGNLFDNKMNTFYRIEDSDENIKILCDRLNCLVDENEQLKQAYTQLKHRHSLLHDVCLDVECERDSLKKDVESLEKDNEQLKKDVKYYKIERAALFEYIDKKDDLKLELKVDK